MAQSQIFLALLLLLAWKQGECLPFRNHESSNLKETTQDDHQMPGQLRDHLINMFLLDPKEMMLAKNDGINVHDMNLPDTLTHILKNNPSENKSVDGDLKASQKDTQKSERINRKGDSTETEPLSNLLVMDGVVKDSNGEALYVIDPHTGKHLNVIQSPMTGGHVITSAGELVLMSEIHNYMKQHRDIHKRDTSAITAGNGDDEENVDDDDGNKHGDDSNGNSDKENNEDEGSKEGDDGNSSSDKGNTDNNVGNKEGDDGNSSSDKGNTDNNVGNKEGDDGNSSGDKGNTHNNVGTKDGDDDSADDNNYATAIGEASDHLGHNTVDDGNVATGVDHGGNAAAGVDDDGDTHGDGDDGGTAAHSIYNYGDGATANGGHDGNVDDDENHSNTIDTASHSTYNSDDDGTARRHGGMGEDDNRDDNAQAINTAGHSMYFPQDDAATGRDHNRNMADDGRDNYDNTAGQYNTGDGSENMANQVRDDDGGYMTDNSGAYKSPNTAGGDEGDDSSPTEGDDYGDNRRKSSGKDDAVGNDRSGEGRDDTVDDRSSKAQKDDRTDGVSLGSGYDDGGDEKSPKGGDDDSGDDRSGEHRNDNESHRKRDDSGVDNKGKRGEDDGGNERSSENGKDDGGDERIPVMRADDNGGDYRNPTRRDDDGLDDKSGEGKDNGGDHRSHGMRDDNGSDDAGDDRRTERKYNYGDDSTGDGVGDKGDDKSSEGGNDDRGDKSSSKTVDENGPAGRYDGRVDDKSGEGKDDAVGDDRSPGRKDDIGDDGRGPEGIYVGGDDSKPRDGEDDGGDDKSPSKKNEDGGDDSSEGRNDAGDNGYTVGIDDSGDRDNKGEVREHKDRDDRGNKESSGKKNDDDDGVDDSSEGGKDDRDHDKYRVTGGDDRSAELGDDNVDNVGGFIVHSPYDVPSTEPQQPSKRPNEPSSDKYPGGLIINPPTDPPIQSGGYEVPQETRPDPKTPPGGYQIPSSPLGGYEEHQPLPGGYEVPTIPLGGNEVPQKPSEEYGLPKSPPGGYETPQTPQEGYEIPKPNPGGFIVPTIPNNGNEEPQKPPEGYEVPKSSPGGYEVPQTPQGGYEVPQKPPEGYEVPKSPQGSYEAPQTPQGGYEVPQKPPEGYEVPKSPPGGYEAPQTPKGGYEIPQTPARGYEEPQNPQGEYKVSKTPPGGYEVPHIPQPPPEAYEPQIPAARHTIPGESSSPPKSPGGIIIPQPPEEPQPGYEPPSVFTTPSISNLDKSSDLQPADTSQGSNYDASQSGKTPDLRLKATVNEPQEATVGGYHSDVSLNSNAQAGDSLLLTETLEQPGGETGLHLKAKVTESQSPHTSDYNPDTSKIDKTHQQTFGEYQSTKGKQDFRGSADLGQKFTLPKGAHFDSTDSKTDLSLTASVEQHGAHAFGRTQSAGDTKEQPVVLSISGKDHRGSFGDKLNFETKNYHGVTEHQKPWESHTIISKEKSNMGKESGVVNLVTSKNGKFTGMKKICLYIHRHADTGGRGQTSSLHDAAAQAKPGTTGLDFLRGATIHKVEIDPDRKSQKSQQSPQAFRSSGPKTAFLSQTGGGEINIAVSDQAKDVDSDKIKISFQGSSSTRSGAGPNLKTGSSSTNGGVYWTDVNVRSSKTFSDEGHTALATEPVRIIKIGTDGATVKTDGEKKIIKITSQSGDSYGASRVIRITGSGRNVETNGGKLVITKIDGTGHGDGGKNVIKLKRGFVKRVIKVPSSGQSRKNAGPVKIIKIAGRSNNGVKIGGGSLKSNGILKSFFKSSKSTRNLGEVVINGNSLPYYNQNGNNKRRVIKFTSDFKEVKTPVQTIKVPGKRRINIMDLMNRYSRLIKLQKNYDRFRV